VEGGLATTHAGDSRNFPRETIVPFLATLDSDAYAETIEGCWGTIAGPNPWSASG
jgi:hypothetical protein